MATQTLKFYAGQQWQAGESMLATLHYVSNIATWQESMKYAVPLSEGGFSLPEIIGDTHKQTDMPLANRVPKRLVNFPMKPFNQDSCD
jgi:hypothetical protein